MTTHLRSVFRTARIPRALCLFVVCTYTGALADGLPGEYVVTSRWRTMFSAYTALPNAALLTQADYLSVRGVLSRTLNEFNMVELGVTVPIGLYQSAGFTWLTLGTASYEAVNSFTAAAERVNANDNVFVFTYALNPWRKLSIGLNLNIAHQNLFGAENRAGIGVDLGLTYRLFAHPLFGEHLAGAAIGNLVPPNFGVSEGVTVEVPEERQATALSLSLFSGYWEHRIETAIDFTLKDLYATRDEFMHSGAGATKKLEWDMNARLGAWMLRMFTLHGLLGFSQGGVKYGGMALGFNLPSVNLGRDMSFLYQLISVREGEALTHSLYLRADMGRHREEIYARRMARLLNLEPNDLYNRALALFMAGKYWDAFFVFGQLQSEYPDFFKRDWVTYYMAACLEHLDMRRAAVNDYIGAIRDYPRSAMVPYADLGLMRVYYREADYAAVAAQLNRLMQPDTPDSLKSHAYYIMGQSHMKTGEYRKARQLFEMIPPTHPEYLFAQHSLAVVNVISGSMDQAVENLRVCANAVPRTKAQAEIINRSLVLVGYLYYELSAAEGALAQAVTALRSIPKTSYYYEDAQLGLGWTAIRAQQWQDCITAADALLATSARPVLRAEAGLMKAYAYMMRREYLQAVELLREAQATLESYVPVSEDELARRNRSYAHTREGYDEIAREAQQLAASRQSDHVRNLIATLRNRQTAVKDTIERHLRFLDENYREGFFVRSAGTLKEDIEYALAVAEKLGGFRGLSDLQQKSRTAADKQREIDEQIRKLQQQMELLDSAKTAPTTPTK